MFTRYRYVLFLVFVAAMAGAVGYGFAHRPSPVVLNVLPPQPTPLPALTATPGSIRCYVTGAVESPGVYLLQPGALVQDAVRKAGGPAAAADLVGINLAMVVQDQAQIVVPTRFVAATPSASSVFVATTPSAPSIMEGSRYSDLININTADKETLETLPGIGPVLAERIIDYRNEHGAFATVQDLINVKGIGAVTLEKLQPLITVWP
jgi:competence protein ComEA